MLNLKMNTNTVSVTDYELRSPTLAKVILSFTGKHNRESIQECLAKKFDGVASLVENSFRIVSANVAVGFVRANRDVRVVDQNELTAKYKVISSNVLMSTEDKTLWSKQEGKGGMYLTRQSQEDLSELMASVKHHRADVPALRHLATAKAAKSELVAFVTPDGSMDYGFAVQQNDTQLKVVSFYSRATKVIAYADVVSITPITIEKADHKAITAGMSAEDKSNAVAYWKQLYGYAPDYLQEVIRQVEEDAVA